MNWRFIINVLHPAIHPTYQKTAIIITTAAHFAAEAGVKSMRTNGETRSGVSKKHSHLKKTSKSDCSKTNKHSFL